MLVVMEVLVAVRRDESGTGNFRTDRHCILYYGTVPIFLKYKICHLQLFLQSFYTVFDFISFIDIEKFQPDRFCFPYCNTATDRSRSFSSLNSYQNMPQYLGTLFPNFGTRAQDSEAIDPLKIHLKSFFQNYIPKKRTRNIGAYNHSILEARIDYMEYISYQTLQSFEACYSQIENNYIHITGEKFQVQGGRLQ